MYVSTSMLKSFKIKGIVNVTRDVPNRLDIETIRIPVEDSPRIDTQKLMLRYFPVATAFIDKIRNIERGNVLIHCIQGIQRSPTIITAYLIKYHHLTLEKSLMLLAKKNSKIFNYGKSVHFAHALQSWWGLCPHNPRGDTIPVAPSPTII